jgi:hypothetical protein
MSIIHKIKETKYFFGMLPYGNSITTYVVLVC